MTEAKIFSMETRQKELENKNLHEHYYVRDILKKLIYTMETSFISAKTLSEMQRENQRNTDNQIFDVKQVGVKRRGETPERKLKDS